MSNTFSPSRYIQSKDVGNGVVGAYLPFGHQVTFLPSQGWEAFKSGRLEALPQWVLDDLRNRRFLVRAGEDEAALRAADPGPPGLGELWLVVVQSCNMACQYCVVEGNVEDEERRRYSKPQATKPQSSDYVLKLDDQGSPILKAEPRQDVMTPEIALAACEMFERLLQATGQPTPRVTFYGGEPMLNPEAIRAAVPRLRKIRWPAQARPEGISMLMITNGQIYDPDLTDFFRQHGVMVSVSLDGMQHHHDAVRVNHGGGGTFNRAMRSLQRYKEAGLTTGICLTIGNHNVNDLPDIADYFADNFGVPVEFQVPFNIGCGGSKHYVKMVDAFPKAMEAYERMRRRGLIEGLAFKRVAEMASGGFRRADCSAVGSQITVAPDGALGPCHSLVGERINFVGNALDPDANPFETPIFKEWAQRYPVNMEDCHGCPAIAICGGGCPYNALVQRGSIWAKDPQQCSYMDALIDWFIDDCWHRYQTATTGIPTLKAAPAQSRPAEAAAPAV